MSDSERRLRVIDMMLSMHSRLAQIYRRRGLLVDVGILLGSAVVVAGVFADAAILAEIGIPPSTSDALVRILSVAVFTLAIISLRVDWSSASREHEEARKKLAELKHEWKNADCGRLSEAEIDDLRDRTDYLMTDIARIPDSLFNRLKAYHRRKVRLSKSLDDYPAVPLVLLKVLISIRQTWRLLRKD